MARYVFMHPKSLLVIRFFLVFEISSSVTVLNPTEKNDTGAETKKIIPMIFNLSEIRKSVGDYRLLTSAELRILIKGPSIRNEQRVELYQGLGKARRHLVSRFVSNVWKDKWMSFDVTESLQTWLKGTGEKK